MRSIENEAMEYIRRLFRGNSDGHGFEHSVRVYRNALRIAETEPECDRQIVALAALLHDADDEKLFQTENNANARSFLETRGLPAETVDRICEVINAVSFRKNRGRKPETPEGRIVQDADRLDAIGAVGIARTFAYGGAHGRSPESSIQHFHEKLLLLKEGMNTEGARRAAESRHAFLETFLEEWKRETGDLGEQYLFRLIRQEEAEQAVEIETICFPPNEACKREHMIPRIAAASGFFWVAEDRAAGRLAGFINGIATKEKAFRDEFFTDASLHDPDGENIMILGLDVLPEYRGQGLGRELVRSYAERNKGKRLVLTCLEQLVPMYEKFGFRDLGESASAWGGERWHEMDMAR